MRADRLLFIVEEPSMEAFLQAWLQRVLPRPCHHEFFVLQGKRDLLKGLPRLLETLAPSLFPRQRIFVVVDCDEDDCSILKGRLEAACNRAGLLTKAVSGSPCWQIATRIVVKELETWYFGDWSAVVKAFPRVPGSIPGKAAFRSPEAIKGKAWRRFEEILTRHRRDTKGISKVAIARAIGAHIDPGRSISPSFKKLACAIEEACGPFE